MSKKNKPDSRGFVYSTNPDFNFEPEQGNAETLPAAQQKLRVWLETKFRGGKAATVITGFIGAENDLEDLGKKLKTFCSTGGTAKDNEIIVQGDQREKVIQWLLKNGYSQTKKAGS
jgi:translation initiation factor 1